MIIWIIPISFSILSNLSIISILITSFNSGTSMIANMKTAVDSEIFKYDNGISLLPDARIRKLKKLNSRSIAICNLCALMVTFILFIFIIIVTSIQPEIKNDICVVFTSNQIDIVKQQNFFDYRENSSFKNKVFVSSEENLEFTSNNNSQKYNVFAICIVIIGVVLSWLLLLAIIISFCLFFFLSFEYINLYPKKNIR